MYNLAKYFIHDLSQSLGIQHAVQGAHKYGRLGIDFGRQHACLILWHVAGVLLVPWYDLDLLGLAPLIAAAAHAIVEIVIGIIVVRIVVVVVAVRRGYEYCVKVVLAAILHLLAAVGEHALHGRLVLVDDVHVAGRAALLALAYVGDARVLRVLAGYFELHRAVLLQQLDQIVLVDVPRQAAEEHFPRVDAVLRVGLGRQAATPSVLLLLLLAHSAAVCVYRVGVRPAGCGRGRFGRAELVKNQIVAKKQVGV